MSWHMSPRYGHRILVSGYSVFTAVNWPYFECPILKSYIKAVDTPPFLLIVSPTPPVQSVDAYVRSVNHVTTKRKEVDHIPWVWGSVPRARFARGSPAKNYFYSWILSNNHFVWILINQQIWSFKNVVIILNNGTPVQSHWKLKCCLYVCRIYCAAYCILGGIV